MLHHCFPMTQFIVSRSRTVFRALAKAIRANSSPTLPVRGFEQPYLPCRQLVHSETNEPSSQCPRHHPLKHARPLLSRKLTECQFPDATICGTLTIACFLCGLSEDVCTTLGVFALNHCVHVARIRLSSSLTFPLLARCKGSRTVANRSSPRWCAVY